MDDETRPGEAMPTPDRPSQDRASELTAMTAAELAAAIAAGEVTAQEVTQAHLDRIAAVEPQVHAFLQVGTDQALAAARAVDAKRAAGAPLGPLAGTPVALKDSLHDQGPADHRRGRGSSKAGSHPTTRP